MQKRRRPLSIFAAKCDHYAEEWGPVADRIWAEQKHKKPSYENYTEEKREHPELAAFEHADGAEWTER